VRRLRWLVVVLVWTTAFGLPIISRSDEASAGHRHTSSMGVEGDCWKAGTPLLCRNTWAGAGQLLLLRVIDQLGADTPGRTLWTHTVTAHGNWNVPQGPQSFRDFGRTNDTWIYMKRDNTMSVPNGRVTNCGYFNGSPTLTCGGMDAGNIVWSELFLPGGNATHSLSTAVIAHELGHTIGLGHHASASSLMQQGTSLTSPSVTIDIAADAGCTAGAGNGGVSCIFATN
jgi:hypothetical protein